MASRTARLRGREEDPPEADEKHQPARAMPAFLRPETNEPDARDEALPKWTRPPIDWREEHDLVANGQQHRGLAAPGAPTDDNPCALRLKLPGPEETARPVEPRTTYDDRAWVRKPYRFTPRGDGGWDVRLNSNHLIGTVIEKTTRLEIRRADHWSTLLAVVSRTNAEKLLEQPLLGRTLALACRVFNARWPPGPPTVQLPEEYRKPKTTVPRTRRATGAERARKE